MVHCDDRVVVVRKRWDGERRRHDREPTLVVAHSPTEFTTADGTVWPQPRRRDQRRVHNRWVDAYVEV